MAEPLTPKFIKLRKRFQAIAQERLGKLGRAWNTLEGEADEAALREFSRELHTLKGESRMVGFPFAGEVAHALEGLLTTLSFGPSLPATASELVIESLDWMGRLVHWEEEDAPAGLAEDLERLKSATSGEKRPHTARHKLHTDTNPITPAQTLAQRDHVRVSLDKLEHMRDAIAGLMLARVRLTQTVNELQRGQRASFLNPSQDVKVSYQQLVDLIESTEARLRAEDFEFERLIATLEASSRDLRMVPIRTLFETYPRSVRTIAREAGRQVSLQVEGDEIEVDRVILESIADPLLHLVRNAVDHGIESPEVRRAAGKDAVGTIRLEAHVRGQHLRLSVSDDGAGINGRLIGRLAVNAGFKTQEDIAALDEEALLRLLFLPGFTTRSHATQLSGRGIGLDVVLNTAESLGGSVDIVSDAGAGTTFHMTVPVSVAISTVVMMKVGNGFYALPGHSVLTIIDATHHPIDDAGPTRTLHYQGQDSPVVDLVELLDEVTVSAPSTDVERVIMLRDRGVLVALVGSRDHVEREAVIKSATNLLSPDSPIRAIVPNPDGTLALVIKPGEITAMARGERRHRTPGQRRRRIHHVLVADDSPIIRELIAQALRSRGLEVTEAPDGAEALGILLKHPSIGLLVTDIEMPRMDGLALIREARRRLDRPLKILVVSMRGSEVEKRRAFEVGADDYLVKTDFSSKSLWTRLSKFIL